MLPLSKFAFLPEKIQIGLDQVRLSLNESHHLRGQCMDSLSSMNSRFVGYPTNGLGDLRAKCSINSTTHLSLT